MASSFAALLLAITVSGSSVPLRSQTTRSPAQPRQQAAPSTRTDRHGDPLPDGAIARLGTLRQRAFAASVAVLPDGKTIMTVRAGEQVKYWDADTGRLREQRHLPIRDVGTTGLSADGRLLLTRGTDADSPIDVWDVQAGKRLHRLQMPPPQGIFRAAFSPQGKMLAVAPYSAPEAVVYLWDLHSGGQRELKGIASMAESLAFSPDGKLLAAASAHFVICWSTASGKQLWRETGASSTLLAFTADGRALIASPGFQQPHWRAWDAATGKLDNQLKLPEKDQCAQLAVAPDGRTLVLASSRFANGVDSRVRLWDLRTGKVLHTLQTSGDIGPFLPDGRSFVTNDGILQRWQVATGRPLLPDTALLGHAGQVVRAVYSPDGRRMASAAWDGTIRLWDVATARTLHILRGHEREVYGLAFTPDGKHLVSGGTEGTLFVWDAQAGKEVRRIALHDPRRGEKKLMVSRLHVSPDGKRALVVGPGPEDPAGGPKGILAGWDLATGRRQSKIDVVLYDAINGAFSPDGKLLASGGQLLDTTTGQGRVKLEGPVGPFPSYAFSRDGRLVAGQLTRTVMVEMRGVTREGGIQVWDAGSGRPLWRTATGWVGQIAFSPDCQYLVAADMEGLRLWELASGQLVLQHKAHDRVAGSYGYSFASCLSFAPDGRSLATGHSDSTVLLWSLVPAGNPTTAEDVPRLWEEMRSPEGPRAYAASWRLTDLPREAVPFLGRRLRPATPAAAEQTRRLLAELDSDDFARREAAFAQLRELGDRTVRALREARAASPSLETRRRVEKLLKLVETSPTPQALRELRAVAVLERIGTEEAKKLLTELAQGDGEARKTRAARAALQRLNGRRG